MGQETVLVVEDDPVFQALVSRYLHELDYQVYCTASGREGVKLCQQLTPDVVLCDINLPDISGLRVIETLHTNAAEMPVIVVSASESMSDIHEAVRLGAWDYLLKPIDSMNLLNEAIQYCLKRHWLEDSYLRDCYELDGHINMLYQDQRLLQRLSDELIPHGPLHVGPYQFDFTGPAEPADVWLDFVLLTKGQVLVLMASAQTATGQNLFSLLVFKALLDPLLRQHIAGRDQSLMEPEQLLGHLNHELCHSQTRTAFDVFAGILNTGSGHWRWAQAGDRINSTPPCQPGLALGIWQQATYKTNTLDNAVSITARLPGSTEITIVRDSPQTF